MYITLYYNVIDLPVRCIWYDIGLCFLFCNLIDRFTRLKNAARSIENAHTWSALAWLPDAKYWSRLPPFWLRFEATPLICCQIFTIFENENNLIFSYSCSTHPCAHFALLRSKIHRVVKKLESLGQVAHLTQKSKVKMRSFFKGRRRLTSVIITRFLVKHGNRHLGTANDLLSSPQVFLGGFMIVQHSAIILGTLVVRLGTLSFDPVSYYYR